MAQDFKEKEGKRTSGSLVLPFIGVVLHDASEKIHMIVLSSVAKIGRKKKGCPV